MSSPTPAYYPDPSIPGYIRYWNGSAWVPGTSRPAPLPGEDVAPPPNTAVAAPSVAPAPAPTPARAPAPAPAPMPRMPAMEESGPMFLDEEPGAPASEAPAAAEAAPAASWQPAVREAAPVQVAPRPAVPEQVRPTPAPMPPAEPKPQPRPQPKPQPKAPAPAPAPAPWAQQVHDLAKPVAGDPVLSGREQARPAPLGRRLAARVLDQAVMGAVVALAAVPLGFAAYDHIQQKVDEARRSGETVTVWLIDGTTAVQLAVVVAVAVVTGLLYEVLPTAKWGRTLGKKLLGLRVLDVETQYEPGFRAALRRWLTHTVLDGLVIGFLGLAWCLFDRPWRQCWHDKVARTFVAGD